MRFKLHSDGPGPPCKHMEAFLNREAEGSARGFARWYALAHAIRCTRCQKYLDALRAMIERLRSEKAKPMATEVKQRLAGQIAMAAAQLD